MPATQLAEMETPGFRRAEIVSAPRKPGQLHLLSKPGRRSETDGKCKQRKKDKIVMPKFMVTHTLPPKGISRDKFCQIATATQQDPNVKCHESFANLTEIGRASC